jgi:predicted nucleic-acid-binding protein
VLWGVADGDAAEAASPAFANRNADFADCLIDAHKAEAGCDVTATFDGGARLPRMEIP